MVSIRFLVTGPVSAIREELIETKHGRQKLVLVAEMVLAELPGCVPKWLEQPRDRRILPTKSDVSPWDADRA
jgi:hypothetical protein